MRQAGAQSLEKPKRTTCDFIGAGTGGPETYHGRTMLDTHRGMNTASRSSSPSWTMC
jgi:hemoglobin